MSGLNRGLHYTEHSRDKLRIFALSFMHSIYQKFSSCNTICLTIETAAWIGQIPALWTCYTRGWQALSTGLMMQASKDVGTRLLEVMLWTRVTRRTAVVRSQRWYKILVHGWFTLEVTTVFGHSEYLAWHARGHGRHSSFCNARILTWLVCQPTVTQHDTSSYILVFAYASVFCSSCEFRA